MAGRERAGFHAFYCGEDFGRPRRGSLAVVAIGLSDPDAAALAAHELAEGYFGARETLSPLRAAAQALSAINQWLYDQGRQTGASMAVSLLAILFAGSRIGVIQVGDGTAVRWRDGDEVPLALPQVLPGSGFSGRAVGADQELPLDTDSDEAAPGDRYLLLTHGADWGAVDQPQTIAAEDLAKRLAAGGSHAIVIDVLSVPAASRDEVAELYAALPLRPPPQPGEAWDGFVIGRKLYQGRYTVLHLALDRFEHREVVLKLPLPGIVADQVFRAGFMRESWIGSRINSPYVARYIALAPGRQTALYLAMPFYQGQTLEERLAAPPAVNLLEGLEIARKLCHAITDLGRLQVVHRDIKPENILLVGNGDLRLLDLGIAYLPGIDTAAQSGLGGTTRYMAPELFKAGASNEQTEIFSLAITLYRMWSGGRFPFGQREVYPLARLRPDLPAWLGHCLARALAVDPSKRFDTAANFAAALDAQLMLGEFPPPPARSLRLLHWQIAVVVLALVNLVLLAILIYGR